MKNGYEALAHIHKPDMKSLLQWALNNEDSSGSSGIISLTPSTRIRAESLAHILTATLPSTTTTNAATTTVTNHLCKLLTLISDSQAFTRLSRKLVLANNRLTALHNYCIELVKCLHL